MTMSFLAFMRCYLWDITYYVTSFVRPRWCKTISATSLIWRCLCDVIFTMPLWNFICAKAFVWFDLCNLIFLTSVMRRHFYDFVLCETSYVTSFSITFSQWRFDGRHWIRRRLLLCHLSVGEVWQNWKSGKFKIPIRIINHQPMKPN